MGEWACAFVLFDQKVQTKTKKKKKKRHKTSSLWKALGLWLHPFAQKDLALQNRQTRTSLDDVKQGRGAQALTTSEERIPSQTMLITNAKG